MLDTFLVSKKCYLTHINVKKLRAAMSRFRCSNHILKIERGRYDGTNEENRYCPLCTKKGLFLIENEFHLIKKYLLEK